MGPNFISWKLIVLCKGGVYNHFLFTKMTELIHKVLIFSKLDVNKNHFILKLILT